MSHWQVTFQSATGQVATFGLEAPDGTTAFQHALHKAPFTPDTSSVAEIPPLCAEHKVRHNCTPPAGETTEENSGETP